MKNILILANTFVLFLLVLSANAQMPAAISIYPSDATAFDTLTITFDPASACFESGSLAGAATVAMHSGISLINGTTWNNVIAFDAIGANGQDPIYTDNGDGTYSFTYVPSEFYDIAPGSIVTQICAVFNNGSDWSTDGRDFVQGGSSCVDFFIPLNYSTTAPSLLFNVNMNKQIANGNFNPATDSVYAIIDGMDSLLLENTFDNNSNPLNIYTGEKSSGLTEGQVINFHFRMNAIDETVARTITLSPGTNTVDVWFDDISLAMLSLNCDMQYYINYNLFDTINDFLDVAGSFNNWDGTNYHLEDPDGDNIYSLTISDIDPYSIIEFKFRINGDWATAEFPNMGPNRVLLVPAADYNYNAVYNNYMPGAIPVTFICHMDYQVSTGAFNTTEDFLDIGASFNNWAGGFQLTDLDQDMAYSVTWPVDISSSFDIEYKFRINGDWATAEFPNGDNRTYTLLDTTGGVENIIDVWFNNDNPNEGSAPRANNVSINGELSIGSELQASYEYEDINGDIEGETSFKWAIADDSLGTNMTTITDGLSSSYTIVESDAGKYVFLDVRPIAQTESGNNSAGTLMGDTISVFTGPVWNLSISSAMINKVVLSPNPVSNYLNLDNLTEINNIELISILGQPIKNIRVNSDNLKLDMSSMKPGIYIIKMTTNTGEVFSGKLIKEGF